MGLDCKLKGIMVRTLELIAEMHSCGNMEDKRDCDIYARNFINGMTVNEEIEREYTALYKGLTS